MPTIPFWAVSHDCDMSIFINETQHGPYRHSQFFAVIHCMFMHPDELIHLLRRTRHPQFFFMEDVDSAGMSVLLVYSGSGDSAAVLPAYKESMCST